MAPALVEHSVAKERSSTAKKYLENCLPPLDLVLVDNLHRGNSKKILQSKLYAPAAPTCDKVAVGTCILKEKENTFLTSMLPNSVIVTTNQETVVSQSTCKVTKSVIDNTNKVIFEKNNVDVDSGTATLSPPFDKISDTNGNTVEEVRMPQPVATLDSKQLSLFVKGKQESVERKFFNINTNLSQVRSAVQKLRLRNIFSHSACKLNAASSAQKESKPKLEKLQSNFKNSDLNNGTRLHPQDLCELDSDLHELHDVVTFLHEDDTDSEEDCCSRVRSPVHRGKKKTEKPTPSTSALHSWKETRVKVGSHCSWLTLNISSLDKKISALNKVYNKLNSERRIARIVTIDNNTIKVNNECTIETSETGSGQEEQSNHGCTRTLPVPMTWSHKYIKKPVTEQLTSNYACRNLPSVQQCSFCKQPCTGNCYEDNKTAVLDPSFHPSLSFKNDISLHFLLEQTLRKQKINTRVTITKLNKKKKKLKPSIIVSSVETHNKVKSVDVNHKNRVKLKAERSRSDEYTRKRNASERESSGRFRKVRKLSDTYSCDSSKPSTPTYELMSPLGQSLNSSGIFSSFNKNKKKSSSSGDYDINNIVIPYSMAASTRLERIQYKEIPTPGWRNIDADTTGDDPILDRELTDDETFIERHARSELLERKRFTDFFQLSANRRSRQHRSTDALNSGPPSPIVVEELKSILDTPVDSPSASFSKTAPLPNLLVCAEEERDAPWLARKFPLLEKDLTELHAPPEDPPVIKRGQDPQTLASLKQVSQKLLDAASTTPTHSPLQSPSPLSSPSTPVERNSSWTVKVLNENESPDTPPVEKPRKGIVLKLAKK